MLDVGQMEAKSYHFDKAIEWFQKAVVGNPEYWAAWRELADTARIIKNWDLAREAYEKLKENPPVEPMIDAYLAYVYQNLGLDDQAIEHYQIAIDGEPDAAANFYNLGVIYQKRGNYEQAILLYEKARELDPYDENFIYGLGSAYCLNGERSDAMKMLDELEKAKSSRTAELMTIIQEKCPALSGPQAQSPADPKKEEPTFYRDSSL